MPASTLKVVLQESLAVYSPEQWNCLVPDDNPFLRHEFLYGLESTGCLEPEGWFGRHITIEEEGKLVAALPLYLRSNSYGEFVFDWAWADAYERAGGRYYPKLVSAIPFTPVRGSRLLVDRTSSRAEKLKQLLVENLLDECRQNNLSSCHCLFPSHKELHFFSSQQFLTRKSFQFHWHNHGYSDFNDFLDTLTSKKRKQIKRERRQSIQAGIEINVLVGAEIDDAKWRIFYDFYCSTFYRRWGNPRLTLDFFRWLSEKMPESTLLILARQGSEYIAGAYAMLGEDTLFGRHWGCSQHLPFLHFELCYYQTIEYCINHGLKTVDAGVQGEHKLSRGFEPVQTWSSHWIQHPGFRQAIDDFLQREGDEIDTYINYMKKHSAYRVE